MPSVTIQLSIYNELYVVTRLVIVCKTDCSKDKMKIMVLDGSDDNTVEILVDLVTEYKKNGYDKILKYLGMQ